MTPSFGAPHRHYAVTDSTNARGRELAAAGAPNGTVVTADEQTEGRGRQGRTWVAPSGRALLYSLLLRPLGNRPLLPLAAALAVCETAEALAPGIECKVKWPNDVQGDGRKLAGILIEARPQDDWAVIGIGLNLSISPDEFPPDLKETAISLFGPSKEGRGKSRRSLPAVAPTGLPPTLLHAAVVLSRHLARWVDASDDEVLGAWRECDALEGREVSWDGGSGVAGGVDGRGNLVVATAGGAVTLNAGEVHLSA
jgi:BirA family transcriptional regulator, biotin operon repressor / biotin---[acetyl-CoA-carboxylase] ligase